MTDRYDTPRLDRLANMIKDFNPNTIKCPNPNCNDGLMIGTLNHVYRCPDCKGSGRIPKPSDAIPDEFELDRVVQ